MRLLAAAIIAFPSLALAQAPDGAPPPPPPVAPSVMQPPPPPPEAEPSSVADGWQFQARLPTTFGVENLITPGFVIAHRSGNMAIGAELGVAGGSESHDLGMGASRTYSLWVYQIMPTIYLDVWQSKDGRARMNLVGGIGYGQGNVTSNSNDGMGMTTSSTDSVSYVPAMAGFGGDYFLSRNFAMGVELGAWVPFILSVQSAGTDQHIGGMAASLRGVVRFTFVVGD